MGEAIISRRGGGKYLGDLTDTLVITGAAKPQKTILAGLTKGGIITAELDPALAPLIVQGNTIGDVTGTFNGKKWQTGITMSTVEGSFEKLVVSGLGFTPSIVICLDHVNGLRAYIAGGSNYFAYVTSATMNVSYQTATIPSGGFTLIIQNNTLFAPTPTNRSWIAIE